MGGAAKHITVVSHMFFLRVCRGSLHMEWNVILKRCVHKSLTPDGITAVLPNSTLVTNSLSYIARVLAKNNATFTTIFLLYFSLEQKTSPRGICLIINNNNFSVSSPRDGTDVDKEFLKGLFQELDFGGGNSRQSQGKTSIGNANISLWWSKTTLQRKESWKQWGTMQGKTTASSMHLSLPSSHSVARMNPYLVRMKWLSVSEDACACSQQPIVHDSKQNRSSSARGKWRTSKICLPQQADLMLAFSTIPGHRPVIHVTPGFPVYQGKFCMYQFLV